MKTARILFVLFSASLILLTACGTAPAPTPEVVVVKETVIVEQPAPTQPAPAEPAQPQPEYAPFCEAAPAGCEAPTIEMGNKSYCNEKQVYAIMSAPAGTTYESMDPEMKCVDQTHADGSLRITCWVPGKQLLAYDLKACNGACAAPDLDMGSSQCPSGYGFDAANQCCAQQPPADAGEAGCTTFRVEIGTCANVQ